jgi:hypothetical protein
MRLIGLAVMLIMSLVPLAQQTGRFTSALIGTPSLQQAASVWIHDLGDVKGKTSFKSEAALAA